MQKKTFVTGGSGHVGANLIRELLARGVAVKALFQPGTNNKALDGLDIEKVPGDLRDPASLEKALVGCDRMYHVAAFVSLRNGDREELFDVNVNGAKHLFNAAQKAGVERTVYCSSFGAIGVNPNGPSDETFTVNPYEVHLDYELSKAVSELEVHRAIARGMDIVIVNPSGVVGPHDYLPSSVGRTILDFAAGRMRAYLPGGFEFVAVRDAVAGHLLAMEKGKTGERYILSSGHHTLEEILKHLHSQIGAPMPRFKLSLPLMTPVAYASSFVMKRFFPDVPPRFTPGTIKLLSSSKSATTAKAQRELGFKPTSIFDAYNEQIAWFEQRGELKRRPGFTVPAAA